MRVAPPSPLSFFGEHSPHTLPDLPPLLDGGTFPHGKNGPRMESPRVPLHPKGVRGTPLRGESPLLRITNPCVPRQLPS
ncbi:hypothetical protein HanOQP8_Chr12g0451361 [Helianthus annuus]|nr:hypothetical protein HanIR_Chr12g0591131 [Helianthus annuus]KAJ0678744.1 hypothetical protein HanOQP8_Chr12g0451361 [Helianthus annuus]